MRAAVRGWSPVIMSTRIPAAAASAIAGLCLRARRVDDADDAEVDEFALDRLVSRRTRAVGKRAVGDGERAQRIVGEAVDRGEDLAPALVRERSHLAGRALGVQRASSTSGAPLVTTATPSSPSRSASSVLISLRSEVNGTSPSRSNRASRASCRPAIFASATRNAASVGIALDRPLAVLLAQDGVVREAPSDRARRAPRRAATGSSSGRPSTRSSPSGR